ncbi:MAG: YceI family protein [Marinovum sp.]|nr:YceI family protein [Marinovum sp.]
MNKSMMTLAAFGIAFAGMASAETWTLDGSASQMSFGSVKKDVIGEVHHFNGLSGSVDEDGAVSIDINLASVETYIDIRNARILEHVFKFAPSATLTTSLDMDSFDDLKVGGMTAMDIDGDLRFLGAEIYVPAQVLVARLGEDTVLVTSDMVYVSTEELEVDSGIDKLMELADLPGITRTVPVSVRLVFIADGKGA